MRIGFDLDGVLLTQSSVEIVLCKGNEAAEKLYYETREPLLNPYLFATDLDDLAIVTARAEKWLEITARHCAKFFPAIPFYHVPVPQWLDSTKWLEWFKEVAHRKAMKIRDLELDVYFEDIPETVLELRKILKDTRIIQYGGRLT